jgi:cell division protein FtsW
MDRARRTILIVTGALLALGMVMIYSASFVVAEKKYNCPTYFLQRHAIYLLAGCLALAVTSLLDYHKLTRYWKWFIVAAVVLLVAVLLPALGAKLNGARRWFSIAGLTIQPSEAVKPLMILGLAGWIVHARDKITTFERGFLPGAGLALLVAGLTALEPDLGSAGLLACLFSALLFVGGVRLKYALPAFCLTLPLGALLAYSKLEYIRNRVAVWWSGSADPLGRGYHVTQSMIAQGSGGIFGAGLGRGYSKLLYLPEIQTDFIFSLLGEELGFLGALATLALFAIFVIQGWRVARRAPDMLGALIAMGVTLCIGFQAAINIAVVTHAMPTKGIALPLISYGGSSLVFTLAAIGLLLNVASHKPSDALPDQLGAVLKKKKA